MIYRFGDFELDTELYELRRQGAAQPVEPQVFDLLRTRMRGLKSARRPGRQRIDIDRRNDG